MNRELLEQKLSELPLYQYAFVPSTSVRFSERVRYVCEHECPRYNSSWACPPAVGSVEACRDRCMRFPEALIITSVTEVSDIANIEETLSTRAPHEELTRRVAELLREQTTELLVLSTESCALCEQCAWPGAACVHPERMYPCIESYGIVATALAEQAGMEYYVGNNIVTWFSILFFR